MHFNILMKNIYFVLYILSFKLAVVSSKSCLESVSTLSYVPSCPDNEEDLSKAIHKKQCKHLANVQSCTKPEDFRYHCILNSWRNATVEVCVPVIFSQGKGFRFCFLLSGICVLGGE